MQRRRVTLGPVERYAIGAEALYTHDNEIVKG
jgi:hypothetical protein